MSHPNIGPDIAARVEKTSGSENINFEHLADGQVVRVHTQNSIYEVAVIDPSEHTAAVRGGSHIPQALRGRVRGSRFPGSTMTKVHHICPDLHFEFNPDSGGLLSTSTVQRIEILEDRSLWQELVDEASKNEPTETMSEEEAEVGLQRFLVEKIESAEKLGHVRSFLENFGIHGKLVLSGLVVIAEEHGKFDEAMELLQKTLREEWEYWPPFARANVSVHVKQSWILESLYEQLELPKPSETSSDQTRAG